MRKVIEIQAFGRDFELVGTVHEGEFVEEVALVWVDQIQVELAEVPFFLETEQERDQRMFEEDMASDPFNRAALPDALPEDEFDPDDDEFAGDYDSDFVRDARW